MNWPKVRLGSAVLEVEAGFACGKSKHVPEGAAHLRPFNVGDDLDLRLNQVYHVPPAEAPAAKVGLVAGDVLFNNTNSADLVGKVAYVGLDIDAGFSNHMTRLRFDRETVEPAFAAYVLHRLWLNRYFERRCTRWVSQAAFNSQALKELEIPLPPLPEQRRIVDILNRANGIRRLRREALDKSRQLIPALFVEMFGDPVANPRGWPQVRMANLFERKPNYGTMISPSSDSGSWLDLRVANIQGGRLDLSNRKYVELAPSDIDRHSLCDGDLILARAIGSREHLGKSVVVYPGKERWAFDSHVMRVLDRSLVLPEFVNALLTSRMGRALLMQRTRQSAVQFNINTKEFASVEFPLPPIALQREFGEQIADIQATITQQESMAEASDQLVASLMAQLFDGSVAARQAA